MQLISYEQRTPETMMQLGVHPTPRFHQQFEHDAAVTWVT
jgi:hypothetical protein